MTYYSDTLPFLRISESDAELRFRTQTTRTGVVVQCYIGGVLADWQAPAGGAVEFVLPAPDDKSSIWLFVVDAANAQTDYWAEAFALDDAYGNRLRVRMARDFADNRAPSDRWRVYRGNAGDRTATIVLYEADVYPIGEGWHGWGVAWGYGGWGWGAYNTPGWGFDWGNYWGFGTDELEYVTDPLARGTYRFNVSVLDVAGNESIAVPVDIPVDTYPRPADDLAVSSYTQGTDTLVLTMTPSEDI